MYENSTSWADLHAEYKEGYRSLEELKRRRTGTSSLVDTVDCELAGSMMGEMAATIRELKNRSLYEYNSISMEDINNSAYGLTERQKEIATLRQNKDYNEVAKILNLSPSAVYIQFNRILEKILNRKEQVRRIGKPIGLSEQQEDVYIRYFLRGMKPKEIASDMKISVDVVKMCLHRIKSKQKTGNKSVNMDQG